MSISLFHSQLKSPWRAVNIDSSRPPSRWVISSISQRGPLMWIAGEITCHFQPVPQDWFKTFLSGCSVQSRRREFSLRSKFTFFPLLIWCNVSIWWRDDECWLPHHHQFRQNFNRLETDEEISSSLKCANHTDSKPMPIPVVRLYYETSLLTLRNQLSNTFPDH